MTEAINLLPEKSKLQLKQLETIRKVRLTAIVMLAGFLFFSLLTVGLKFYLQRQVAINKRKLAESRDQFIRYLGKLDELQNLRLRTKLVAQTMERRFLLSPRLKKVLDLLGEGVSLEYIDFKGDQLEVRGVLPDLSSLAEIERRLLQENLGEVQLENLGISEGKLSFLLKVKFLSR